MLNHLDARAPAPPRAYPGGLGKSLEQVYRKELGKPIQGDLRVNRTPGDKSMSQQDLFAAMPLWDTWPDADLQGVFEYLFTSRANRTGSKNGLYGVWLGRIPSEWCDVMAQFKLELETRLHIL